jgi:hypothetical protein
MRYFLIYLFCLVFGLSSGQNELRIINGQVIHETTKKGIPQVAIQLYNSIQQSLTDASGKFILKVPVQPEYKLVFRHLGFQSQLKTIKAKDSFNVMIYLKEDIFELPSVEVAAVQKPETLVGKPDYSIVDFDFYEDKFILLTTPKSLLKTMLRLSDASGKILHSIEVPDYAGEAQGFFRDYTGGTLLLCKDTILKVDVMANTLYLWHLSPKNFNQQIKPVQDSLSGRYYFSNQWPDFPLFSYYSTSSKDSVAKKMKTIVDAELMKLYNLEYEYLKPCQKLEARRLADYYKVDKTIMAALMSGFTKSMFYEPLYAPLFVLNDTICIFDHYSNQLFHFSKDEQALDSVRISYHHPKRWRDWKRRIYKDETENKVYGGFSKDGHHYLKYVHHRTGKVKGIYRLQHHSATHIKLKGDYVYYIYRPFESTQEKFLYREKIQLESDN